MYFKKIEMHGFKSFAEPVTIDFSSGITCIVGPNGSGKSNISDAIRWVLGEQSPKMLRGGKMEEVIFSGTSSRKSRGMAEAVSYTHLDVYKRQDLESNDILLLCSDGLYGEVPAEKIAQILKTDQNMNDMCTSLVQEALEAGGRDNITVICLKI